MASHLFWLGKSSFLIHRSTYRSGFLARPTSWPKILRSATPLKSLWLAFAYGKCWGSWEFTLSGVLIWLESWPFGQLSGSARFGHPAEGRAEGSKAYGLGKSKDFPTPKESPAGGPLGLRRTSPSAMAQGRALGVSPAGRLEPVVLSKREPSGAYAPSGCPCASHMGVYPTREGPRRGPDRGGPTA